MRISGRHATSRECNLVQRIVFDVVHHALPLWQKIISRWRRRVPPCQRDAISTSRVLLSSMYDTGILLVLLKWSSNLRNASSRFLLSGWVLAGFTTMCLAATSGDKPHLLQRPALSETQIVFGYAGDLWSVDRKGGHATRLTVGVGVETAPIFSPDGSTIAFTGEY